MKELKIAKEISLPLEVVTQTIAILAKRRVGKSYTMRRLAEQLLKAGQQVILIDPKGDQWGIRSSADGKSPGFPIVILGGEHGDAPLEASAGEVVAKLVVEERVSVLLDLSQFRKHEIATFMSMFLENLYRLKAQEKYRTPVMLVIDEADAIAPQKPQKGEKRMLGAAEDIVRRGGQRGIGCVLVTQRSAVLNKNVLTQAQMLIVLRTIAPQDLAAMKAWIDVHGSLEEGKTLMDSLPSLPVGDAWFWSPGWPTNEGIFKRVHVLPIETFDSAATPAPGEKKIVPKNLADVDLEALKKQMSATLEKAKNDNPAVLRQKIRGLEAELKKKQEQKVSVVADSKIIERAVKEAELRKDRGFAEEKRLLLTQVKERDNLIEKLDGFFVAGRSAVGGYLLKKASASAPSKHDEIKTFKLERVPETSRFKPVIVEPKPLVERNIPEPGYVASEKPLSKGARQVLTYLYKVYPDSRTKTQLWVGTGYSPGGGFNNLIYELTGKKMISQTSNSYSFLNNGSLEESLIDRSFEASLDKWKNKLSLGARKVFDLLLEDPETAMSKEDLAAQTGYAMGGGFNNLIYELTGAELIEKHGPGYIINPEILAL